MTSPSPSSPHFYASPYTECKGEEGIKVTYMYVLTEVSLLICASMWVGNGYSSCAIYFSLTCNNWASQLFILSPLPANSDTYLRKLS